MYFEYFLYLCSRFIISGMKTERERIDTLMQTLHLSGRQFAEQIHVQPGTISNMMTGRNEPSYTVIKKILMRYPTLNPEWLINGKGDMWRTIPGMDPQLFDGQPPTDLPVATNRAAQKQEELQIVAAPQKQISRIVVYYTDNTYEEFKQAPF